MSPASTEVSADTDIAIVGAGPVGLALACLLLRRSPWRLTLIDAATPARASRDPRAIALSYGSRQLLEQIGAWPRAVTPIEHIHVSQRGRFGHVRLHSDDYDVAALGYVVRYGELCEALERALAQAIQASPAAAGERLARVYETRIDHLEQSGPDTAGLVHLSGHGHDRQPAALGARLAVQAEGGLFHQQSTRAQRGVQAQKYRRDYGQTAIVAHVACSRPQPGWAWERFTEEGPLALLPHEEHGTPGYALVWCCPPEQAARRLALPEGEFLAELEQAFGPRMGRFTGIGKRHAFPLGLNAAPVTVQGRVVAVGNAAQTLHPVAGQGLNLGLRDAFALALALRADCSLQALQAFAAQQKLDRAVTIGVTDLLPRVFGVSYPLAAHARGASLAALACLGPLKDTLARQMMYGMRR
ncbi:UbiH/UbiF/VisC/COQ6 family ubiquinone biosynthesis hydroxylase [Cupriavidus sp. CuC1]|uniref:UbiH/UbiF/VisC/COQ6 family ubiquinone biosynthesis hydroxylase n=1 Tax=Cupriavidus sp. CuC1 TaxID=3373131 RepID=UPI0037D87D47